MATATHRPAWVAVPARDEQDHVGDALAALDTAAGTTLGDVHLVIVDDGSTDRTPELVAEAVASWPHGTAVVLRGPGVGSGWARRTGLDHALARAAEAGDERALIATTDADSRVPATWLSAMHSLLDDGHEVIAGDVRLEAGADERIATARDRRLGQRLASIRTSDPTATHPHFAGANLGWTARALASLAPLPAPESLEDDALLDRCRTRGLSIVRDDSFAVITSARTVGRAKRGLATALAADRAALIPLGPHLDGQGGHR